MKEMRSSGLIIIREDIGTKFIPGIHLFITKETDTTNLSAITLEPEESGVFTMKMQTTIMLSL